MLRRKNNDYKIMIVDDEDQFLLGLEGEIFKRFGYTVECFSNQNEAIEILKHGISKYDLLILDYKLQGETAVEVVKKIREFDKELYVLLLTGKADFAPLDIMTNLNIQGYCDKDGMYNKDRILVLIYSALKWVDMRDTLITVRDGFKKILEYNTQIYDKNSMEDLTGVLLEQLLNLVYCKDIFILIDKDVNDSTFMKGVGKYDTNIENNELINRVEYLRTLGNIRMNSASEIISLIDEVWIVKIVNVNDSSKDIGWIWLDFNRKFGTNSDDYGSIYELLTVYANQIALAINNNLLYSKYNSKLAENSRQVDRLKRHVNQVIDSLRIAVDAKNEYTRGHSDRVAEYALGTAEKFYGYKKGAFEIEGHESNATILERAGWFHDVGKIGISDDVLLKPDRLTKEEFEKMKDHINEGVRILSAIAAFEDIVPIVKHHHEKLDGSGYPDGLTAEDLEDAFMVKLISITDSYDAMTSGRVYKEDDEIMTPKQAIEDLLIKSNIKYKNNKGGFCTGIDARGNRVIEAYWYDRDIVISFMKYLESQGYIHVGEPSGNDRIPFIIKDSGRTHPDIEDAIKERIKVVELQIRNYINNGETTPTSLLEKKNHLLSIFK